MLICILKYIYDTGKTLHVLTVLERSGDVRGAHA